VLVWGFEGEDELWCRPEIEQSDVDRLDEHNLMIEIRGKNNPIIEHIIPR